MNEPKISAQPSKDLVDFVKDSIEDRRDDLGERRQSCEELRMSTSASTFTRHTRSIRSIIKDIILGIITIMEVYVLIRISK